MIMSRNGENFQSGVPNEIRRQLGSPAMSRFLGGLAAFKVDPRVPEHFQDLLRRLDGAESGRRASEQ